MKSSTNRLALLLMVLLIVITALGIGSVQADRGKCDHDAAHNKHCTPTPHATLTATSTGTITPTLVCIALPSCRTDPRTGKTICTQVQYRCAVPRNP